MWCYSCLLMVMMPLAGNADGPDNATVITTTRSTAATNSSITKPTQLSFFGNFEMMQRAFYVVIGVCVLSVLYFVIRACSMKRKPQRKKYGLLSNYDETMELGSMDSDEEKIFESRSIRR